MRRQAQTREGSNEYADNLQLVQPLWLRITHWLNALAILIMVTSGWQIYNASPIFKALTFPSAITLGGWLGGAHPMAFRRDVAAGCQLHRLSRHEYCDRPLPARKHVARRA